MKQCCEDFLYKKCKPKFPRPGRFSEKHACPICKQKFEVTFEEIAAIGDDGNSEYVVVAADPIN